MRLINSSLLRARHGFPTREGGVSTGPFSSLNTSYSVGDAPEAVDENLRRLHNAAKTSELLTILQVHGTTIVEDQPGVEADAIWSQRPNVAVGVRTADCLPVLIEDRVGRRVAAVHAGWRGVIGLIAPLAVQRFIERGSKASDLRVAIGPAIQKCCFEVDGDLPGRFSTAFGDAVVARGFEKPHLDLGLAVRRSLEGVGVPADQIDVLPQCTRCNGQFFSHRREKGLTGRQLSFIVCAFETDL